ncbi:MAG: polysaccharide deacetylase family protein [Planctomycetes bacterium]|nr:polysaccharide deacetylase family protein [Planctomycetota bacterium]MBL7042544.1 polysaccharide deacetylase family protein [Pirellulaceae bacterium]
MAIRELLDFAGQWPMRATGRAAVVLSKLLGSRAAGAVGILTYHRTAHPVSGLPFPLHNVTPERFRQQISGLLSRGYHVWPLRKVLEHRDCGQTIPRRTIVVTFDDGYHSVYANAWPIMRELNVPATVFVSTVFLDEIKPFPFDDWGMAFTDRAPAEAFRPLTSTQCREMSADGLIELGAHTHTHQDFRGRPEEFRQDLQTSVDILETRFGVRDPTFAFPFGCPFRGFAGQDLVAAAKQTDVTCGLTTECVLADPASDPFRWGRFNVFPWDTAPTLAGKLAGWYSWAPKVRKAIVRTIRRRHQADHHRPKAACTICEGGR